jgi:hypothetical protein
MNPESPNNHGTGSATKMLPETSTAHRQHQVREITKMKSQCHTVTDWDVSLWFALLSPLLGVLLGFIGAFLLLR